MDADAIVVDPRRNIADELHGGADLYLVEHVDSTRALANTGVFMLRSTPWARALLRATWAQTDLIEHMWWENAAILRLLGYEIDAPPKKRVRHTPWFSRTALLDPAWNEMPGWPSGCSSPVIRHYGGQPLEQRRRAMAADLELVAVRTGLGRRPDRGTPHPWLHRSGRQTQ
jgi:hypothetical protein